MNQPTPPQSKKPIIAPWLLIVLIIALLAAAGYFGWYFWSQSQQNAAKNETATTQPTTSTTNENNNEIAAETIVPGTEDWQTYTNTDYGFRVKVPKSSLGDYKVKTGTYGNSKVFHIMLQTHEEGWTTDDGYSDAFMVLVYNISELPKLQSYELTKNFIVGQNKDYVFVLGFPQDGPSDMPSYNSDQVKSSFSLIK